MKIKITETTKMAGLSLMLVVTLSACSTVRDATDWIPGVDSNAEVKAKEQQQSKEQMQKMREVYEEKSIYAPTSSIASDTDARINVSISQQYAEDELINREDIGIEVSAGVVTLSGAVNSEASAVRAIAIAKNTAGVARVISRLVVIQLR